MAATRILGWLGVMMLALALGLAGCMPSSTTTPPPPNHKFGEPVNIPTLYSFDDAAGNPVYFLSDAEMKWAMQHRPPAPAPTPKPTSPTSSPSYKH
jgi:hypothetical protein